MRRGLACLALPLAFAACGQQPEGQSADDFASRVNGGQASATPQEGAPDGPRDPALPRVAADGRKALSQGTVYKQRDGSDSLAIRADGTYSLVDRGVARSGKWEWLPDGKRLRLIGLDYQPIVLVADGALYRMQNEDVPFDDVTPDRVYTPGS